MKEYDKLTKQQMKEVAIKLRTRFLAMTARTTVVSEIAHLSRNSGANYTDVVMKAARAFELPDKYWLDRFQGNRELTLRQWISELRDLDIDRAHAMYSKEEEQPC